MTEPPSAPGGSHRLWIQLSIPRAVPCLPWPQPWFHCVSPSQPDAGMCLPYGSTSPGWAFIPSELSRVHQPAEEFHQPGLLGCPRGVCRGTLHCSATKSPRAQRQGSTHKGALKHPSTFQRLWVRPCSAPVLIEGSHTSLHSSPVRLPGLIGPQPLQGCFLL